MKFKSEIERKQHARAGLIPYNLWVKLYKRDLSDEDNHHFDTPLDQLAEEAHETPLKSWVSILLSHPEETPDRLIDFARKILKLNDKKIFEMAAVLGRVDLVEKMASEPDAKIIEELKSAYGDRVFYTTAANGKLSILELLAKLVPTELKSMIKADGYGAFREASANGHKDVLDYLKTLVCKVLDEMNMLEKMIHHNRFAAYRVACGNGHFHVVTALEEYLEKLYEDDAISAERRKMLLAATYDPFRFAALNGHVEIMAHLKAQVPDALKQMIEAFEYEAYRSAASNGHAAAIQFLEANAPADVIPMIRARKFEAYLAAAKNGHLSVLLHLEAQAPALAQVMACADQFRAIRDAIQNDQLNVSEHLLSYARVYGFAEMHYDEPRYPVLVNEQTEGFLERLEIRMADFQKYNPDGNFDFVTGNPAQDAQDALYGYYVLRRRIRQIGDNEAGADAYDQITCLLKIPSIKQLVLHNITSTQFPVQYHLNESYHFAQQNNELLRIAVNAGNNAIAVRDLLLHIPAVYAEAAAHGFYRGADGLNLAGLALDNESSMTALTPAEQKQVKDIQIVYRPQIAERKRGYLDVIDELRQDLKKQFLSPEHLKERQVDFRGTLYELPFEYSDFVKFKNDLKKKLAKELEKELKKKLKKEVEQELREKLKPPTELEFQDMNMVYYQNTYHTTWRFLAIPNRWIAPNASFVQVNEHNHNERWSSFEPYQEFIADLYTAAKDETRPPLKENVTVADRVYLFYLALAGINRQHNWDKKRQTIGLDGLPLLNPLGLPILEEFDDGEGDKPSCFSGMKRTLFQALLEHPLYTPFDETIMRQFISELIRVHYFELLRGKDFDPSTLETIKTDAENVIYGDEDGNAVEESETLKKLHWLNGKDEMKQKIDSAFPDKGEGLFYSLIEKELYRNNKPNTFIGHYADLEFELLLDNLIALKREIPAPAPINEKDNADPKMQPVQEEDPIHATAAPADEDEIPTMRRANETPSADEEDNAEPKMRPVQEGDPIQSLAAPADKEDNADLKMRPVPKDDPLHAPAALADEEDSADSEMQPVAEEDPPAAAAVVARAINLDGIRAQYDADYKTQYGKGCQRFFKLPIKRLFKQKTREAELNFLTDFETFCAGANNLNTELKDALTVGAAKLVALKIATERFRRGSLLGKILNAKLDPLNMDDALDDELIQALFMAYPNVPQHLMDFYEHRQAQVQQSAELA